MKSVHEGISQRWSEVGNVFDAIPNLKDWECQGVDFVNRISFQCLPHEFLEKSRKIADQGLNLDVDLLLSHGYLLKDDELLVEGSDCFKKVHLPGCEGINHVLNVHLEDSYPQNGGKNAVLYRKPPYQLQYEKSHPNGILTGFLPFSPKDSPIDYFLSLSVGKSSYKTDTIHHMVFDSLNIDQSLMDQFYYHSSRKLLWPIFHGLWEYAKECSTAWTGFVKVNNLAAEHLANRLSKNANVVIHDYNFLLVPNKLKQLRPDVCISYFHHIPWNSQAFQLFRYRLQILNSLKNCDHIYMHIPYYINELYRSFNENMVTSVIDYQSSMPKFNVSQTSVCCKNYSSRIQLGERSVSCYAEPMPINTNVTDE